MYNGGKYLNNAIRSVLDQTYQDWEMIIYNNGSTDNTSEIINYFKDKRIKVYDEKECVSRAIPAWDKVMNMGNGDYLLMLGHDDWFNNDFLEISHQNLSKENLDIFSGCVDLYDPECKFIETEYFRSFLNAIPQKKKKNNIYIYDGKDFIDGFITDFENGFSKMHLSTTWIRRSLYEMVGGFNLELQYCAESELYLKLAFSGARIGFFSDHSLVNFIGIGSQRRAGYFDEYRRFHDFYLIPNIMFEKGMVNHKVYSEMIKSVNKRALKQGESYSFIKRSINILFYTSEDRIKWLVLNFINVVTLKIKSYNKKFKLTYVQFISKTKSVIYKIISFH